MWPSISDNDPDNCVNYKLLAVADADYTTFLPDDCTRVEKITKFLYTDPDVSFSVEDMLIYDLQMNFMWPQPNCQ